MRHMWEMIKHAWKSSCEVFGKKRRVQKEWLTAATMRVVDKRTEKKQK